jgi:hypothetical protein
MERSHYWILKTINWSFGTGYVWFIKGTANCCCEQCNERLVFQIMQNISWLSEEMPVLGAGVCLMELFGCFSPVLIFTSIALGVGYEISLEFGQLATDLEKKWKRNTDAGLSVSFTVHFY